ncbi:TOMM precursor leader peptide-binding protein [Glaciecola sp. MH2013]|uniref:TOMM precursor leader peptide-binding protein n=1 Tax=Glaciecola sp. MH2013 TaxID=2785524 RepID=UPI00189D0C88|nr:TOMM precursor leader peptide-binding protein [Glaciecola sp. MH2013]MBF7073482.1 TOMM precursor leader peptide-binding protein [Glaciecola sp. MH2013]
MSWSTITVIAGAGSNALADLLIETVGIDTQCNISLADIDSIETPINTSSLVLVAADFRIDMPQVMQWQSKCRQTGTPMLLVSQSPGTINIGPFIRNQQKDCIGCWHKWVDNNHRLPSIDQNASNKNALIAQSPWSPAMPSVFNALFAGTLERLVDLDIDTECHYWRFKIKDFQFSEHVYNNLPQCLFCENENLDTAEGAYIHFSEQLRADPKDARVPNPKLKLAGIKKQFVDRHSGVIKHLYQSITSSLMPMYTAEMQLVGSDGFESGFGRAETSQKSEMIAILEGIERFAGYSPKRTKTNVRGSYESILESYPNQCVNPEDFILHDDNLKGESFALLNYEPTLEYNWCWGFSMKHRQPVLIPEQLVYYRLDQTPHQPVNRFIYDSSNGCAMGGCIEEAILCGLYEVLERDAYLTTWYSRAVPDRIDNATINDDKIKALIARAESEGFEIYLFNMVLDIQVPVVWAMIVDPTEDAQVKSYCASAASGKWHEAIFSALVEVVTSMGVYRHSMPDMREKALALLEKDELVVDMPDHVLLYSAPESYARLNFLHQGKTVSLEECEQSLPSLYEKDLNKELHAQIEKTLKVASDVIVVKQSFDKMEEHGLHSVKVMAPGLMPVTFGHQHRRVSFPRLDSATKAKGQWLKHFNAENINPFPHNFP